MKFDIGHLLKTRQLARIPKSNEKANDSMKVAHEWLKEAKSSLNNKLFKSSILTGYLGMFHSARAILYLDGFREKSHFAIARYLECVYVKNDKLETEWIEILDFCRELRHGDQYRTSFVISKEEARDFLSKAEKFIKRMESLLNKETREGKLHEN